jgi:hypothetical protein
MQPPPTLHFSPARQLFLLAEQASAQVPICKQTPD